MDNFEELAGEDAKQMIKSMATKLCEANSLPTKILKEVLDIILLVITRIVNASLKTRTFAGKWKTAIIRPLLKKITYLVSSNYRPVSNLSFISKVVEKAALLRLNAHCEKNKLMSD